MMRFFRYRHLGLILGLLGWAVSASAQTTVAITGGEAGEGLTLDPAKVLYAFNVNGSAVTVQGVAFASLDLTYGPANNSSSARTDPFQAGQNAADDDALRNVFQTLAWDGDGVMPLTYTFTGLTPDTTYQLDVLHFSGFWNSREVALVINGASAGLYTISQTEGQDTIFDVTSDGSGDLDMQIVASANYGGSGFQDGGMVSGFVLSTVAPVPEPATWAALLGAGALACAMGARWRGRRA